MASHLNAPPLCCRNDPFEHIPGLLVHFIFAHANLLSTTTVSVCSVILLESKRGLQSSSASCSFWGALVRDWAEIVIQAANSSATCVLDHPAQLVDGRLSRWLWCCDALEKRGVLTRAEHTVTRGGPASDVGVDICTPSKQQLVITRDKVRDCTPRQCAG